MSSRSSTRCGRSPSRPSIAGRPFLGICFGAQVLAWSLGAPIVKAPVREVGYVPLRPTADAADDAVLGHYDDGDLVFEWHMDTFDLRPRRHPARRGRRRGASGVPGRRHARGRRSSTSRSTDPEIELWVGEVAETVEEEWGRSGEAIRREADVHQEVHEAKGAEVFRRFAGVVRERA